MDETYLQSLLKKVKSGKLSVEKGVQEIKNLPYEDLGYAKVDHHRVLVKGYPEAIYCEGKKDEQIVGIVKALIKKNSNITATRIHDGAAQKLLKIDSRFIHNEVGRICTLELSPARKNQGSILIVSGGTTDLPVVEEAFETAKIMGNSVNRLIDVGVAGIHRLLDNRSVLEKANVIIVAAGMEGALASVVAGLVDKPVIAVPTSIGYGSHFGGLSALLGMLNTCVPGVLTVNIDNGFGAAYGASLINRDMGQ